MTKALHFLHIEDDEDDIDLLQEALKENGVIFSTEIARSGQEAFDWINENITIPDLIIMDLNLPVRSGREVLKHIKENKRLKDTSLIVLSTSSNPEDIKFCNALGIDGFVTKPNDIKGFNELVATILKVVAKHITI